MVWIGVAAAAVCNVCARTCASVVCVRARMPVQANALARGSDCAAGVGVCGVERERGKLGARRG